ncbi:glycosyltransferase family 4 protein [bacterium]|nr:glycosyltransferase family 4 protein [bacterium]
MKKRKIAFVIQRYGLDIAGGAELHCRYVCENLKEEFDITVLTTCAQDYITWENYFNAGEEIINGIKVLRFKVKKKRDPIKFGQLSNHIFYNKHDIQDELEWLEIQGPFSTDLIKYIDNSRGDFDIFIFFSYRYYHSYWGIKTIPEKAFLVPTAEEDPAIRLEVFTEVFKGVRGIFYNSPEEKDLINRFHKNIDVPSEIVGVGIKETKGIDWEILEDKYKINRNYIIYIGRIDNNKGCNELFRYFKYYSKKHANDLKLLLVGKNVIDIPKDERIVYLGFVDEEEKMTLLSNSVALAMPSKLESLSMVLLEAWSLSIPTLVSEHCKVLAGQCKRSNGGLFYRDTLEFSECLSMLYEDRELNRILGQQGNKYFKENYSWDVIRGKYKKLLEGFLGRM